MDIEIHLITDTAKPPERMSGGAAGYDIFSDNTEDIILSPMQRVLVPTGITIALLKGYEAQIRPRSGLAVMHGITILNAPGTIDSDYRGEIKVILINLSNEDFTIKPTTRIAQMIVASHEVIEWVIVDSLDATTRGSGGFGHTKT